MNDIDGKTELFRETYARGTGDAGDADAAGGEKTDRESAREKEAGVAAGAGNGVGGVGAYSYLVQNQPSVYRAEDEAEDGTDGLLQQYAEQEQSTEELHTEQEPDAEEQENPDRQRNAEKMSPDSGMRQPVRIFPEADMSVEEEVQQEPDQEKEEKSVFGEKLPDFALMPAAAQNPDRLIPADGDLKSSRLRITELYRRQLPVMTVEEDVLVPDVEPDLKQILHIDARPEITSQDVYQAQDGRSMYRIGGTLSVNTLYVPVDGESGLISITSRIRFRRECGAGEEEEIQAAGNSSPEGDISVELLSAGAKVINERKIRIRAEIRCTVKKYVQEETEFLEGVRDSELSLKKETIHFTDIAQRRTDTMDVSGEVVFRENMPKPEKILHYDISVAEVRRQIGKGKAVIDACAFYSILYFPEAQPAEKGDPAQEEKQDGDKKTDENGILPVFYRGRLEFTQFIRLPDLTGAVSSDSQVSFDVIASDLKFEPSADGGGEHSLMLSFTVAAGIDVFRDMEREIVTDMYHRSRDVSFSSVPRRVSELGGSGSAEVSVREIITLPESKPGFGRVPYVSASVKDLQASVESGKCRIEGVIATNTVYRTEDGGGFSSYAENLPFHTVIDIPGAREGMTADCGCVIREIHFDRMNARQTEFSCTLAVSAYVWRISEYRFIDRVCYIEREEDPADSTGMVVYVTRSGDTQWSIAKQFRTTIQELRLINGLEDSDAVEPGRKLLIL